ncbi:MAG TPA: lipid A biosynthesis [bacterium]|nr:lipid A biosynthesis [bacterium]
MFANAVDGAIEDTPLFWWIIGFGGQLVFTSRFFVQWIASERARRSVVPTAFWWLSLTGGLLLLAYSIYRRDPVFIMAQATGGIIYVRNLMLIRRTREEEASS